MKKTLKRSKKVPKDYTPVGSDVCPCPKCETAQECNRLAKWGSNVQLKCLKCGDDFWIESVPLTISTRPIEQVLAELPGNIKPLVGKGFGLK